MSQLGLGVMINMLGSNKETVDAYQKSLNKVIKDIKFEDDLRLTFDTHTIKIWDDGQSCCENRYMTTDDDLDYYKDSILTEIKIESCPSIETGYGEHEIQFLKINTSKGTFTIETHNEHNGYYGGFYLKIEEIGR